MKSDYFDIYKKYFVEKDDERLGLFRVLVEKFNINSGLYPGSFVHITPSLVIPHMVYVDMDKRCEPFFNDDKTKAFVDNYKVYDEPAIFRFYKANFSEGLGEKKGSFDILISLYAGFISKYCGEYLKKGGILLANNSHGDAPLAFLDKRFELIGIVKRNGNRFRYSEKQLDTYFIPNGKKRIEKEAIEKTMKGPEYTNPAYAYVFRKTK